MKPIILLALMLLATTSFAEQLIFSCKARWGKEIKVIQDGVNYQFSYGWPNKPRLVFNNSESQLKEHAANWEDNEPSRVGLRNMFFQHGVYTYHLRSSINRMKDEYIYHAGVYVFKNDKKQKYIKCLTQPSVR